MVFGIIITILLFFIVLLLISGIRIINQYERGVKFSLGKYTGILEPGLNWVIPMIQWVQKVDIRQRALELKPQDVMTKDQVNLHIDGVIFFNITRPDHSVLNVENVFNQLHEKATSELKEIVGNKTMSEALKGREKIAIELKKQMETAIKDDSAADRKPWGVSVRGIQINNIELPEKLVRAMAKEAEAEREKKAIVIRAKGEEEAAESYKQAALVYAKTESGLRLRELKTYEEIGKEHNSLMLVIPREMTQGDAKWVLPFAKNLKPKKRKK